jgi:hypothetical protein
MALTAEITRQQGAQPGVVIDDEEMRQVGL